MDDHRCIGRRVSNSVLLSRTQRSHREDGRDAMLQWMVALPSQLGHDPSPTNLQLVRGSGGRCVSILSKREATCLGRHQIDSRQLAEFWLARPWTQFDFQLQVSWVQCAGNRSTLLLLICDGRRLIEGE